MKKIYLLIILFIPFITLAQPTITASDLPVSGLVFVMGTDSGYTAAIPAGGSNQTWDYTSLQNLQNDTSGFFSSSGTPYASQFTGSNLASYDVNANQWSYFTAGASGFYIDGLASSSVGVFRLTPGELFVPVPFTYGNTRNNTARIQIDSVISGVNYRLIETIASDFNADGFGTLNLPSGNYNNTLRVKDVQLTTDSILVDLLGIGFYSLVSANSTQQTYYRWFHNGTAGYLLGIQADSLGTTANYSEYLINSAILSTHDPVTNPVSLLAYPNPASQTVYLTNDLNSETTLIILNSLGQVIEKRTVTDKKIIAINLSTYSNGLYEFTLISASDRRSGRFTVQQ